MAHIDVEGRDIELNEKGYLVKFEDWNDKVAETLAKMEGIALEQCH